MSDNCYWVDEFGAIELCTGAAIPGLPVGWVTFDAEAVPTVSGRVASYNLAPGWTTTTSPASVKPCYGNGVIVQASNYNIGVDPLGSNGSHETYAVHVSTDDGFTYSVNEPYVWQPGAGTFYGGYDAYAWSRGIHSHWGTKISFDGTNFVIVNGSNMDIDDATVYVVTAYSSDGVNWTTNKVDIADQAIIDSDSMPGKLWYLGLDDPASNYSGADGDYSVGFSDDYGATWTNVILGDTGGNWNGEPYDEFSYISANQAGLHITISSFYDSFFFGVRYYRPTSDTTYAAPIELFDLDQAEPSYMDYGNGVVLASRVASSVVLVGSLGNIGGNDGIAIRRSVDGGLTFSGDTWPVVLSSAGSQFFVTNDTRNGFEFVEMEDGRIAVVFMFSNNGTKEIHYVMSEDAGASWGPLTYVTDGWVNDNWSNDGRIRASSRGPVDFMVSVCARQTIGKTYIVRPPYL